MKQKIKIVVLLIFLSAVAFVFLPTGLTQTNQVKTAGEVYKNIQVLKDMPADQLDKVMATFTGSLGVKCNFCHIPGQWEKDEKPEKQMARKMIKMVLGINKETFDGRTKVSCVTCHQGKPHPSSIPSLEQNSWQPAISQPDKEVLPTVDQILDKYITALGGKKAIEKVKTRILKGSRIGADGIAVPEEVYQKAPDKIFVVTTYPQNAFSTSYNGTQVWAWSSEGERKIANDDSEQFKREGQFFQPTKIKEIYKEIIVTGTDKINNKDVFVVRAISDKGTHEQLFFDKQTGLLVRRFVLFQIIIGMYPYQVDYSDYKAFDGVQVPLMIQWSIPGRIWGRKITEVKQNTAIDDAKFNQPPTKN